MMRIKWEEEETITKIRIIFIASNIAFHDAYHVWTLNSQNKYSEETDKSAMRSAYASAIKYTTVLVPESFDLQQM